MCLQTLTRALKIEKGKMQDISPRQQHMFISLLFSANSVLFRVVERFRSLLLR